MWALILSLLLSAVAYGEASHFELQEIDNLILSTTDQLAFDQSEYLKKMDELSANPNSLGNDISSTLKPPEADVSQLKSKLKKLLKSGQLSKKDRVHALTRLRQLRRFEKFTNETNDCPVNIDCPVHPQCKERKPIPAEAFGPRTIGDIDYEKAREHTCRMNFQEMQECEAGKIKKMRSLWARGFSALNLFEGFTQCAPATNTLEDLGRELEDIAQAPTLEPHEFSRQLKKLALESHRQGIEKTIMARRVVQHYYGDSEKTPSCAEVARGNSEYLNAGFEERCRVGMEEMLKRKPPKPENEIIGELHQLHGQVQDVRQYGRALVQTTAMRARELGMNGQELRDNVRLVNDANQRRIRQCTTLAEHSLETQYPRPLLPLDTFKSTLVDPRPNAIRVKWVKAKENLMEKIDGLEEKHRQKIRSMTRKRVRGRQGNDEGLKRLAGAMHLNPQATIQTLMDSNDPLPGGAFCKVLQRLEKNEDNRKAFYENLQTAIFVVSIAALAAPLAGASLHLALRGATAVALRAGAQASGGQILKKRAFSFGLEGVEKGGVWAGNTALASSTSLAGVGIFEGSLEISDRELQIAMGTLSDQARQDIAQLRQEMNRNALSIGLAGVGWGVGQSIVPILKKGYGIFRSRQRMATKNGVSTNGFYLSYSAIHRVLGMEVPRRNSSLANADQLAMISFMRKYYGGANARTAGYSRETNELSGDVIEEIAGLVRQQRQLNESLLRQANSRLEYDFIHSLSPVMYNQILSKVGPDGIVKAMKIYNRVIRENPAAQGAIEKIKQQAAVAFPDDPKTQLTFVQEHMENIFLRIANHESVKGGVGNPDQVAMALLREGAILSSGAAKTSQVFWTGFAGQEGKSKALGALFAYLNQGQNGIREEEGVPFDITDGVNLDPAQRDQILEPVLGRKIDFTNVYSISEIDVPLEDLNRRLDQYAAICAK